MPVIERNVDHLVYMDHQLLLFYFNRNVPIKIIFVASFKLVKRNRWLCIKLTFIFKFSSHLVASFLQSVVNLFKINTPVAHSTKGKMIKGFIDQGVPEFCMIQVSKDINTKFMFR